MTQPTVTTWPPPPPPAPPSRRHRWWRVAGVVLLAALATVVVGASFVHVPYVIISPGDATPLDERIVTVSGARTYPHSGDFVFLTVQVSNRDPSVWRWLFAQLDGDVSVEKKQDVIGCASYAQSSRFNDLLMRQSQDIAKTVALRTLGYNVVDEASMVVIVDVKCGGPSEGRLAPGDVIQAVDGQPVASIDQVKPLVVAHRPGDTIAVTIVRDGKTRTVRVRLGELQGKALLGIATQAFVRERYPFDVRIDTRRVSGPSAGLAFTLAIIDDLTPGNLTGGRRVAVTGSILPGGRVAPVGGVEQKAATARENGATLMLVPACSPPEHRDCEAKVAREHAGGMRVVIVETVDDALKALQRAGGDPVPARRSLATGQ